MTFFHKPRTEQEARAAMRAELLRLTELVQTQRALLDQCAAIIADEFPQGDERREILTRIAQLNR